jgi:hypothetical protein
MGALDGLLVDQGKMEPWFCRKFRVAQAKLCQQTKDYPDIAAPPSRIGAAILLPDLSASARRAGKSD